jgi:hypothetical protein
MAQTTTAEVDRGDTRSAIEVRCCRLRYLVSSLSFVTMALEDTAENHKSEGHGAAMFLAGELQKEIDQFEEDLTQCKEPGK